MAEETHPWKYHPNVISVDESKRYYETFKSLVRTEKDSFKLMGKTVQEQRYKNFFSRDGHSWSYSGMNNDSVGWPKEIEELASIAKEKIGCEGDFDSALVNFYPNGVHYLSAHNDKDSMQGYIASFSFGAQRTFRIRKMEGREVVKDYEVANGSLFVMEPGMQQEYLHEVPKRLTVHSGRINVTLRQQQHLSKKRKVDKSNK